MLEVRITGGLGNQMFQYAFYKYLSLENKDVTMDISDYKKHNHHHGFELKKVFGIIEPFTYTSKISRYNNTFFSRVISKVFKVRLMNEFDYYEDIEVTNIMRKKYMENHYFLGFWQDVKYIKEIQKEIYDDFTFVSSLDGLNLEVYEKNMNRNTVSVHIRRGDYLGNSFFSNICDIEYYHRAISYMSKKYDDIKLIIFSDDIEWSKENFQEYDAVYVEWNNGEDSYKDMQLMSVCKHNIIGNSTFSWWAAFLNRNENKTVICPRKWANTESENKLIMDGWLAF